MSDSDRGKGGGKQREQLSQRKEVRGRESCHSDAEEDSTKQGGGREDLEKDKTLHAPGGRAGGGDKE